MSRPRSAPRPSRLAARRRGTHRCPGLPRWSGCAPCAARTDRPEHDSARKAPPWRAGRPWRSWRSEPRPKSSASAGLSTHRLGSRGARRFKREKKNFARLFRAPAPGGRALAASFAGQAQLGKLNGRHRAFCRAFRGFFGRSAPSHLILATNRADFAGRKNRLNLSPTRLSHGYWNPNPRRTTMSRKTILTLASAATLAVAMLASQSADARGFGGGGFASRSIGGGGMGMARFAGHGGRTLIPIIPGRPGRPGNPHWTFHHHDHGHWVFRFGRWIVVDDVVDEAPAVVTAPGPCTCLAKNYTPSGLVVFADVCTKESASASVYSSSDASLAPTTPVAATAVPITVVPPTPNYGGRTYDDYLAANPQSANPAPQA